MQLLGRDVLGKLLPPGDEQPQPGSKAPRTLEAAAVGLVQLTCAVFASVEMAEAAVPSWTHSLDSKQTCLLRAMLAAVADGSAGCLGWLPVPQQEELWRVCALAAARLKPLLLAYEPRPVPPPPAQLPAPTLAPSTQVPAPTQLQPETPRQQQQASGTVRGAAQHARGSGSGGQGPARQAPAAQSISYAAVVAGASRSIAGGSLQVEATEERLMLSPAASPPRGQQGDIMRTGTPPLPSVPVLPAGHGQLRGSKERNQKRGSLKMIIDFLGNCANPLRWFG